MINPTLYIESLAAVVLPDDATKRATYLDHVRAAYLSGTYSGEKIDTVSIGDDFIIGWTTCGKGYRRPIVHSIDDESLAAINSALTVVIPHGEYETLLAALRRWRRVVIMRDDGTWERFERERG